MAYDNRSQWLIAGVAGLFVVGGVLGVTASLYPSPNRLVSLLLGVLNAGVGVGLLMKRPGLRGFALVMLALQLGGTVVLGAMLIATDSPLTLELLNRAVALDGGLDTLVLIVVSASEVVSLVALTRPSVRRAFQPHS
ncbi:MAG: hypothetical protein Q7W30_04405 [Coriobacteriia bacterium]|nr:hypothetical protein [Coriobacteriia bacterium]